jgi:hypothetical protein
VRKLREDELDEILSVKYLVKSINLNAKRQSCEVWHAVKELARIGEKYVCSGLIEENEINELLDLDDMKELVARLFQYINDHLDEASK